jgi:Kdo2-lipid IVA lauroyltransferase/acyltransferase
MNILYWFLRFFGYLLSLLPYKLIFLISDFLYIIVYYLVGYRKAIVFNNIRNSFPEKNDKEIKIIAKKFYHNLCDLIFELIKANYLSFNRLQKTFEFTNVDLLNKYYEQGRSVLYVCGHTPNWEIAGMLLPRFVKHEVNAVYLPLSNNVFDKIMINLRSRFGVKMVSSSQSLRKFVENKNKLTLNLMVADQSPIESEIHFWTNFLNQDTPVFLGVERIAKKMDYVVVFTRINRVKRGNYEVSFIPVTENPKETKEFEITEKHTKILEETIKMYPDNYLWSHRRWKHKRTQY